MQNTWLSLGRAPISLLNSMGKPYIGITIGDPAGVGPEVARKAIASVQIQRIANIVLIGDVRALPKGVCMGCASAASGRMALGFLDEALRLLEAKRIDALVTGPISKKAIYLAGFKDGGHTEYLAQKTRTRRVAMMFVGKKMRLALVTRHIPIRELPRFIKKGAIEDTIGLLHGALKRYFKIGDPKIAVLSFNPHGGLGAEPQREEIKQIIPAIKSLKRKGINAKGPFSADGFFRKCLKADYDAIVAMYHDQGLAPLKMVSGNRLVNMTLGLPFVRTSPDHGTAFDIAGKGIADATSMKEAIILAAALAKA